MRRRIDAPVIHDPSVRHVWHSAGERQVILPRKVQTDFEVPELWRRHARQPWRVIFPDLDWHAPEIE